jgi:L-amino acid N-acyltransferase YncA
MESLEIRPARLTDAAALAAIYAPYVTGTAITFEYVVPTAEAFAARMAALLGHYPYLTAWRDGMPIGYAYAGPFHPRAAYAWSAEVSIYLRQDCRGGGVGRALYEALESHCRAMGLQNLYACIALPASPEDPYLDGGSVAFHTQLGYHLCGQFARCGYKFDRWYDMVWMEKMIGDHPLPAPPRVDDK